SFNKRGHFIIFFLIIIGFIIIISVIYFDSSIFISGAGCQDSYYNYQNCNKKTLSVHSHPPYRICSFRYSFSGIYNENSAAFILVGHLYITVMLIVPYMCLSCTIYNLFPSRKPINVSNIGTFILNYSSELLNVFVSNILVYFHLIYIIYYRL